MSEPYPPAETPPDSERTQVPAPPRFAASASVPVPPAAPGNPAPASFSSAAGPGGVTYGAMPGSPFGQGSAFGQPPAPGAPGGQPPAGQAPAGQAGMGMGQPPAGQPSGGQPPFGQPASGGARASASVPPSSPAGTYGSAPPTFGNPPAPATYGAGSAATYGSAPAGYPAQQPAGFGQPPGGQFDGPGGGVMFGQPPAGQSSSYGSAPSGYGSGYASASGSYSSGSDRGSASAGAYGQGGYGQGATGTEAARPAEPEWPTSAPERKPRRGLIIALIAAAILVVVGVGAYVGWSMKNGNSEFVVGACVQQRGGDAAVVDCSVSGAYKITSIVDGENTCPDANQPSLELTPPTGGKKFACLAPAAAAN